MYRIGVNGVFGSIVIDENMLPPAVVVGGHPEGPVLAEAAPPPAEQDDLLRAVAVDILVQKILHQHLFGRGPDGIFPHRDRGFFAAELQPEGISAEASVFPYSAGILGVLLLRPGGEEQAALIQQPEHGQPSQEDYQHSQNQPDGLLFSAC